VNKKSFEQILDLTAEHWFIGTEGHTATGKNRGAFEATSWEEGGFPHVIKFKLHTQFCVDCCCEVNNRVRSFSYKACQTKCSCGKIFYKKKPVF